MNTPGKWLAFVVTALLHGCVLWFLTHEKFSTRRVAGEESRVVFIFLPPERATIPPEPSPPPPSPRPRASKSISRGAATAEDRTTAPITIAPEPQPETSSAPSVDWANEARSAAKAVTSEPKTQARSLDSRPGSKDGSDKKQKSEFEWTPYVPPVSLTREGLLQIRVGPCFIIGLAFGCELGKKPSRGDLFEHMGDPNEAEGSVPK